MATLISYNRTDQSYVRAESDCFCNTTLLASVFRMFHTTWIATEKNTKLLFLLSGTLNSYHTKTNILSIVCSGR